jgi:hypothetical protein
LSGDLIRGLLGGRKYVKTKGFDEGTLDAREVIGAGTFGGIFMALTNHHVVPVDHPATK